MDTFIHGKGCDECNQTGYLSRMGVFELFNVDDEIQDMIQMNALLSEILSKALIKGMVPLTIDGISKVEQKITTLEELLRVIPRRQILAQLQKRYEEY
jgi:type II secretory ATPase GspE/PulE/Tfp pilus assembly ATPase PilB-like protein